MTAPLQRDQYRVMANRYPPAAQYKIFLWFSN